ncbi:hypothetical protein PRUB_b0911 [Pseudoalteromonas rubra]|uniref:Uncharacterized protein n=1 Tax=Pseudoalteromonas rubra TaxID=43658 RepID=A0A8T0C108_9GAMM|nr:hypothetical protein [Pseudoalteromonas rubra]KAF7781625.1 hypothetical protein PRUB_b0911 [Pseudoalteromonas rubra]
MKPFRIKRENQKLVLTRSKISEVIGFVLSSTFLAGLILSTYNFGLSSVNSTESLLSFIKEKPSILFFIVIAVLLISNVVTSLKFIVLGEKFAFDGISQKILKNSKFLLNYSDVKNVQIRVYSGDTDSYDLSLITIYGNSLKLADFKELSSVKELAGHIGDYLNLSVVIKE